MRSRKISAPSAARSHDPKTIDFDRVLNGVFVSRRTGRSAGWDYPTADVEAPSCRAGHRDRVRRLYR